MTGPVNYYYLISSLPALTLGDKAHLSLESYLYRGGYGPTSETLAKYLKELVPDRLARHSTDSGTEVILTLRE